MGIGQNIKNARKCKGLSQKQLGELLHVSQAAIGQFESEKSTPKLETIEKIAAALSVPVSDLLELGSNNPVPSHEDTSFLEKLHTLNDKGKEKAFAYLDDIAGNPKYKR